MSPRRPEGDEALWPITFKGPRRHVDDAQAVANTEQVSRSSVLLRWLERGKRAEQEEEK